MDRGIASDMRDLVIFLLMSLSVLIYLFMNKRLAIIKNRINNKVLFDIIDNYLVVIDENGLIIEKNSKFDAFVAANYPFLQDNFFNYLQEENLVIIKEELSKTNEVVQTEIVFKTHNRSEIKSLWQIRKDNKSGLYYLLGRQLASENYVYQQLQQSEEKSRKQFKSVPVPTYSWKKADDDFVLSDYNDIVFNETEGKVQHLMGISARKLLSHNPEIIEDLERCFIAKDTIVKEIKYFVHETEEYKYYSARYAFVPSDTVIVQMEDITGKKLMEIEIEEREEKYRTLVSNITYAVLLVNIEGQILEFNDATVKIFGYTEEELPKTNILDMINLPEKENKETVITHVEEFILELFNKSIVDGFVETTCIKKSRDTFPAELQTQFIKLKDNNILLVFIRDISNRKNQELELQKYIGYQEKANHELKIYNYIISHDLKAPLRAINNLIDWLWDDYADKFDEEGKKMLNLLKNRASRMHELIESILRYSKIGKSDVVFEETDLNQMLSSTISLLHIPKNIEVKIAPNLPTIMTVSIYLQQIFQNLLSNSIKFMDKPNGVIEVGFEELEDAYKFWIRDNGPGIDEKFFEKVFQLFQTLQSKDEYESTGVGLSIVKKIIDTFEGKLWLDSKVGTGTTFYFTLPKT